MLIIKDRSEKPYYLSKKYSKTNTNDKLAAGTVYTRTRDTNTPINSVANPLEIEKMWKQRFGLSLPPLKRASKYLVKKEGWENNGEDIWYYKDFPEFTITTDESSLDHDYEWTRGEIGYLYPDKFDCAFYYYIKYYGTVLAKIHAVLFDNKKKSVIAPEWHSSQGGGRIYYYLAHLERTCKKRNLDFKLENHGWLYYSYSVRL